MYFEAVELLRKLCEIPSLSGREGRLSAFIADYLEKINLAPQLIDSNVLLNPNADFIVATHLDTVRKKVPFYFDGEFAYGTGASDAKGSITAILLALKEIKNLKFGVAFFCDEEDGGGGSKIFSEKYKPRMAVVMEPTSLKIAEKHCGNIEIEIFVRGKESHGAVPEAGENAVDKCLRIIDQIGEITSLKPTILQIKGGDDDYSIPDFCRATIDIIVPPGKDVKYLLNKIKSINGIIVKEFCNGFEAGDSKTILSKALKNAGVKVEFTSMPSWTDAVNLYSADCDTVVWGPGELALCHTRNERVAVREIVAARKVLVELNRVIEKGI